MSILTVEHLTHGFGDRAIFSDVSFRLLRGEHIGLVGANGEGKSTFFNIVTGNLTPDEGKIDICIFSKEDDIIFQIEDNGVGMTEEMCREILQRESGDRTGIGIKNVNDRIKIYFGEEYGITIASELDEGTCVTIRMPKIKEDKYEK